MAYRRNNYDFVIDSNFSPFSMQEMLTPFVMYKDAYEKTEEAYNDLTQKADTFKYLADVAEENPDSKAAKIYKGYASELDKQAKDLAKNGLSMLNRRALTNLKRRYQGEIGMLARADEQLKELQKQRNALIASGKSMLYANENPTLDDFLEGNESFNRYSIDQDTLRALGMQEGQAASSRIYGSTKVNDITKYYQEIIQTQGYSPELINQFRQSLEAIPEFRDAVNSIMEERGINQNLKGVNWQRAKDSIVNGIIAGSVYKEARNAQPNPGVLTAAQEASNALGWANHALSERQFNEVTLPNAARTQRDWEDQREILYDFQKELVDKNLVQGDVPDDIAIAANPNAATQYKRDKYGNKIAKSIKPEYLNPEGTSGYTINPITGKPEKLSEDAKKALQKEEQLEQELSTVYGSALANNEGFDVGTGPRKKHYRYYGAIANTRGNWKSGRLGEAVGHGWGMFSANNVEDIWGNFSAEGVNRSEKAKMRILPTDEMQYILANNPELNEQFEELNKKMNIPDDKDVRFIEVPNEHGGARVGYLVAIEKR